MKAGEIQAMDRRIYYLHFPRAGATGEAPGLVGGGGAGVRRAEGAWGKPGPEPGLCFPWEKHVRAGETAEDWLD